VEAEAIRELFAAVGRVDVRRMFGGHGVYAEGVMVALEAYGEIWLKADAETVPAFVAVGSDPFTYHKDGKASVMSYRRLPAAAYDDAVEFQRWVALALAAAQRAAAAKAQRSAPSLKRRRRPSDLP
jgi:DNA transformation protein